MLYFSADNDIQDNDDNNDDEDDLHFCVHSDKTNTLCYTGGPVFAMLSHQVSVTPATVTWLPSLDHHQVVVLGGMYRHSCSRVPP